MVGARSGLLRGPRHSDGLQSHALIQCLGGLQGWRTTVTAYENQEKQENKRIGKSFRPKLREGGSSVTP